MRQVCESKMYLVQGIDVYQAFMDFDKAFVDRKAMWSILYLYGVGEAV